MATETEHRLAIGKSIGVLGTAFRVEVDEAILEAYRLGMLGVEPAAIQRGAGLALQRCKFMPVPAELRELATGQGTGFEAMAERAFHALTEAVKRTGPDYSVNFQDGAINAAVRLLGGWIRVCELPCEEFDKWFRKDFIATYARVCRDGASEELRRYHGGRLERDNAGWDGRTLPNGHVYQIGQFGSEVIPIGADYQPALPAPEPKRALTHTRESLGLELKKLPSA